jgi:hypothetical protein
MQHNIGLFFRGNVCMQMVLCRNILQKITTTPEAPNPKIKQSKLPDDIKNTG